jgi:hypothetical protein
MFANKSDFTTLFYFLPGLWGGEFAAVTFLCTTSWKKIDSFFESLNISESSLQNIKKKAT